MVGVKHEHAPAGSDGPLTCRKQRAMLFSKVFKNKSSFNPKKRWKKGGKDDDVG